MSLNAQAIVYDEEIVHAGPLFVSATRTARDYGGMMTVTFDLAAGLNAVGGPLGGFEVAAGTDGVFSPAEATIVGQTAVVKSMKVVCAAFVRHAWAG